MSKATGSLALAPRPQTGIATLTAKDAAAALAAFDTPVESQFTPLAYGVDKSGFVSSGETLSAPLQGVILGIRRTRRHSIVSAPGGPRETECVMVRQNPDTGLTATNEPRACATCPFNRYGSDVDHETGQVRRGKACREKRVLLFLRDGDSLPIVILSPPSSIKAVDAFVTLCATRQQPLAGTHVMLDITARDEGGKKWGVLCFKDSRALRDAEAVDTWTRIQAVRGQIEAWFQAATEQVDIDDIEAAQMAHEAEGGAAGTGGAEAAEGAGANGSTADTAQVPF